MVECSTVTMITGFCFKTCAILLCHVLEKTLYVTFPCLVVLESSSKFQSYFYKTKNRNKNFYGAATSWHLWKRSGNYLMYKRLERYPASQKNEYKGKIEMCR